MVLAPADFYAYSRATGVPVPEDPEERAQIAPEVLAFRRNQLVAPREESNLLQNLGLAAAGLGLAGLGAFGARRLLRRQPAAAEELVSGRQPSEEAVRQVAKTSALGNVVRNLNQPSTKVDVKSSKIPDPWLQGTDLTSIQALETPSVSHQQVQAIDSGLHQAVQRISVTPEQRDPSPFTSWSQKADRITRNSKLIETVENFPEETIRATTTNQQPIIKGNPWEIEELLEQASEWSTSQQKAQQHLGRTVADLTGELEVTPQQARVLKGAKIGQVPTVRGLSAGRAVDLSLFSESATPRNKFTPEEVLERVMAAASYPKEISDIILDPNVPREHIQDFLGTTPKIRGGAVSSNPTMEIAGGARASMPGASVEELQTAQTGGTGLTYHDTTNLKQLQQKEKLEQAGFTYDPNTGNYYQEIDDADIDPTEVMTANREMGTDYGDTEGVGNLLIETESFRERTNKGTTQIPGAVEQASGFAPGSERFLRRADIVLPLRRDPEGLQTAGVQVKSNDPTRAFGQLLRSQDVGVQAPMGIETEDINVGTNKLVGGFEVPVDVVSDKITTQPVSNWSPNLFKHTYVDRNGNTVVDEYVPTSRRMVTGEEPLIGIKRTPLTQKDTKGSDIHVGWTTLETSKPQILALDRATLENVAESAQYDWFNNPTAKLNYLQSVNPEGLQEAIDNGVKLADLGEAYDYQGFIANAVDNHLMNVQGIDLPILKPQISKKTGNPYYSTEANAFVMSLLKTEKDTPIYGERVLKNEQGKKIISGFNAGGYPIYKTTGKQTAIPGQYVVRGSGGVDPMTIGDEYEGNVAYYTPRVDTASQRKVFQQGKALGVPAEKMLGATQASPDVTLMSLLRSQMETRPTGLKVRSPGSFARTQNPYTGLASAVMGPAARVETGNYQYTPRQLTVTLPGVSESQLRQRNQFALAANLTPGGRVVRGGLLLGGGLGAIPAGVGTLSESEVISRYGLSGSQLQEFGNRLMAQAANRKGIQPGPTSAIPIATEIPSRPPLQGPAPASMPRQAPTSTEMPGYARRNAPIPDVISEDQARADAIARHIGNYISAASKRLEGPASIQGVKLKGVGQQSLRPYQTPSEGMIQQLMRAARNR